MLTKWLMSSALVLCSLQAATLTFNDALPPTTTNWSGTLNLPRFDPALGTLDRVTLTLSGQIVSSIFLESLDAEPSTIHASNSMQATATTSLGAFSATATNPVTFNATAYDGVTDFAGTSGHTFSSILASGTGTLSTIDPLKLALFIGLNNFATPIVFSGTSSSDGSGNLIARFQTLGSGNLSVKYDYTAQAAPIPEPTTMALMGGGLIGLGMLARRKRN